MYKMMRYLGMFGVLVLLTIIKALIDGFMNWKAGGGAIPAALYALFVFSVFMMIFMKKDTENGQRNFKIYKYTAFIFGIIFFILCYQAVNRQDAPRSVASTQNQEQIEEYNKAFKNRLWQDHPELSALNAEEQNVLMANMKKWIEAKPYKEAKELLEIYEKGNAEQVSWLMSEYKKTYRSNKKPVSIALPLQEGKYITGEYIKRNNYWYSSVIKDTKSNLYLCGTSAGFVDDNTQVMLIVLPQIFNEGDILSIYIQNSKLNSDVKNGFCIIDFGDGIKSSTAYFVENSYSSLDIPHIVVRHHNVSSLIDLMMRRNTMGITLEGQNISLIFSLSGFTASFKRLLKLSQDLK